MIDESEEKAEEEEEAPNRYETPTVKLSVLHSRQSQGCLSYSVLNLPLA